jgi:hypothetical protein
MRASPIDAYRRQIERELQPGNATEHTHRPALKTLIESLAPGVAATNEPKHVDCGAPDFVVIRKAHYCPLKLASQKVAELLPCNQRSQFGFNPQAFPKC